MAKVTLNDTQSGYKTVDASNVNLEAIETALENTLSRDGTTPNQMAADLDMNGYYILNSPATSPASAGFAYLGDWATSTTYAVDNLVTVTTAQDATNGGKAYICLVAHTSGTFATDLSSANWRVFADRGASGGGSGDLVAASNLSDVANAETSRDNLVALENTFTTRGDLVYQGASDEAVLAIGSAGQHLSTDGTDPEWTNGAWETLALGLGSKTLSSDALFYVYHDGIDGSINFIDGWQYHLRFNNVYGTDGQYMAAVLYEGSAYRTATSSYGAMGYYSAQPGGVGTVVSVSQLISSVYVGVYYGATVVSGWCGDCYLTNMASTTYSSTINLRGGGYASTGGGAATRLWEVEHRPVGVNPYLAAKHIKVYPISAGTFVGGEVIFSRRYVGT